MTRIIVRFSNNVNILRIFLSFQIRSDFYIVQQRTEIMDVLLL